MCEVHLTFGSSAAAPRARLRAVSARKMTEVPHAAPAEEAFRRFCELPAGADTASRSPLMRDGHRRHYSNTVRQGRDSIQTDLGSV